VSHAMSFFLTFPSLDVWLSFSVLTFQLNRFIRLKKIRSVTSVTACYLPVNREK
uniref:Uncharacterized protein n=1 Tax=Aegilops tauschii subsp. strangulata TaxID=200361 RepID=A0A453H512_AEGTS